jgi:thioredoxin 1
MLKEINSNEFKREVLDSQKAVLVDFYASWCGPCKMLAPVLEKIASSRADFNIIKVNIDASPELANKYQIEVVPTLVVFKDGKVVDKLIGFAEVDEITSVMSEYI